MSETAIKQARALIGDDKANELYGQIMRLLHVYGEHTGNAWGGDTIEWFKGKHQAAAALYGDLVFGPKPYTADQPATES